MSETTPTQPDTNQTKTGPEVEAPPALPAPPKKNILGDLVSRLTLTQLTLVVLVVIFVWQWLDGQHQITQVQQEVAHRLADVEGTSKAHQTLVAQNQELVRELGGKLSLLESKFAETQNQRIALDALYQEMSSSRDLTVLADVEQMLLIAGQQLQLSANVKAALIAMQHADGRLQRLDRPVFAGLRKQINRDIEHLRALPNVDVAAINLQLDKLVISVDSLPLVQEARVHHAEVAPEPKAEAESKWRVFLHEIWRELRQLVRVEVTQQEAMPLLSPTQTYFLRENLKLRLLTARLALLSRDEVSFQRELKTAQVWVKRHFDSEAQETVQTLGALQKLVASNIAVEVPDISASLEAVRHFRASQERVTR